MRLLEWTSTTEFRPTEDLLDDVPPYAILSHTWGLDQDEVRFVDVQKNQYEGKKGYDKIRFCGQQARRDGLRHIWVDTCCIDKSNHVELSEAITSMFRWYRGATVCYAYLQDVEMRPSNVSQMSEDDQRMRSWKPAFRKSRWFKRGWTLQELIAPDEVIFFSKEGDRLGSKSSLEELILEITGIPVDALRGRPLSRFSVAERMSWTVGRATKREEDQAYCLLGIFDVFIPLIYGERSNAFVRLKAAIREKAQDTKAQQPAQAVTSNGIDRSDRNIQSSNLVGATPHEAGPFSSTERLPLAEWRNTIMASLKFEQMKSRQSTIKNAYASTCEWFLKHPMYLSWTKLQEVSKHHGFLWIVGKPGTGKSTLMKYIHHHTLKTKSKNEIVVAFYFNARGDVLEKTISGMYRALLFEVLQQALDIQDILEDFLPESRHDRRDPDWTNDLLCRLFASAITRLGNRRLICLVDALDECSEDEVQEMVRSFEEIGKDAIGAGVQLQVCFASRHYPTIEIRCGQKLILEEESGHTEDLARYVRSHLHAGGGKNIEGIRMQILEKSNNVFMWTVLVVDILNTEFRRGRIFAVQRRLREIPTKLSDLFRDILWRDGVNMDDLLLCLQLLLFAARPLSREEFYFAMVAGLDGEHDNMTEWDPEQVTVDDMNRFVLNSSKGLAELTKSDNPTVQFIHESVRDFLIGDNGLHQLWPKLTGKVSTISHDQLKRCCQAYISIDLSNHAPTDMAIPKASSAPGKVFRGLILSKYPFLDYASCYVLHHANEAVKEISQDDFLESFSIHNWVRIRDLLKEYNYQHYTSDLNLWYLFAENNYANLMRYAPQYNSTTCLPDERYQYPFFAALARGNRDSFEVLLNSEGGCRVKEIARLLEFGRAFKFQKHETPLLWALRQGHDELAEILAATINLDKIQRYCPIQGKRKRICCSDIEVQDRHGRSPLSLAAGGGKISIMELLLENGASVDSSDIHGMSPLIWATQGGYERAVQLLLDRNAQANPVDVHGKTALKRPTYSRQLGVVDMLLRSDTLIEHRDHENKTALLHAARYGYDKIVSLLLDAKANVEARDVSDRTPLSYATQYRNIMTVALLLHAHADIEARDSSGRTPLSIAAGSERDVVRLLLDAGADIESESHCCRTPLSYAVGMWNPQIVQLLLESNANVTAKDVCGRTPLCWVFEGITSLFSHYPDKFWPTTLFGEWYDDDDSNNSLFFLPWREVGSYVPEEDDCTQVVQKVLTKLAEVGFDDDYIHAALLPASALGWDTLVKSLLRNGANVQTKERHNLTALSFAACMGYETVARTLLEHDADIETKDRRGRTVLMWAANRGKASVVAVLVEHGANPEVKDEQDRTALLWASYCADPTTLDILLKNGANIEAKDYNGRTSLMWAAYRNQPDAVAKLLDHGANPETQDDHGLTALMWACWGGCESTISLLLARGVSLEIADNQDQTAPHIALIQRDRKIMQLLHEEYLRREKTKTIDKLH